MEPRGGRRSLALPLLLGLGCLVALAGVFIAMSVARDDPKGRPLQEASASPSATASPQPSPLAAGELTRELDGSAPLPLDMEAIAQQVSEVRGLPVLRPIRYKALGKKAWEKLVRPGRASAIRDEQLLVESLGLIPEGVELSDIAKEVQAPAVGLYVPKRKTLFMQAGKRIPRILREVVAAHEITHALQDQNFDLVRRVSDLLDLEDAASLQAVVEGDAMRTEVLWSRANQSPREQRTMRDLYRRAAAISEFTGANTASAVVDTYSFPYIYGLRFVSALAKRGGVEAINDALRDPPRTTEEILHPSAYLSGEGSQTPVVYPAPSGWRQQLRRELGELEVGQLFLALGTQRAGSVADGWDGARIHIYKRKGNVATGVSILYDNARHAKEACRALPDWYLAISGGRAVSRWLMQSATGWMAFACDGLQVDFALAPDRSVANALVGR